MPRPTVMLVGSIQDDREMYAEYLRASALIVIEVDHTADVFALAEHADIIVTEVRVDGPSDGLDLIRQLRHGNRTKQTPIIVLTACAFAVDRQRAQRAGCDAFLPKPCLPEVLLAEIRRVLPLRSLRCTAHAKVSRHRRNG
jgi:two-component system, cell cycle response regulator DivK